jgi:hydrogenase nickel incorporation protein HypA/HybF
MHELSITQQILDIAVNKAGEAGASTIKRINLVIGDMSSVLDDCVQFYFDFLSKDSIAQGAQLSFKRIPLKMRCRQCGHLFTPEGEPWSCPQCREWNVEVIAGNEFYLDSIEVE